jgi:3-carboxy-cis,cis-muconate cycloisomerase
MVFSPLFVPSRLSAAVSEHRDALMVGRTLLQHALPITFGFKAAEWLAGVTRARASLKRVHDECLAAELGGAAGTLASLGDLGLAVLGEFAQLLQLKEPDLPWHTERTRLAEMASTLGLGAGAADKIALDIALLSQTEVQEVAEGGEGRRGGSSTMPQKRNPVGSVLGRAGAREAQASIELLLRTMGQEHERMDPATYLGSAHAFIDRAIARHRWSHNTRSEG